MSTIHQPQEAGGKNEEKKTFFARTSSGLVREFGTLDALLIASAAVFGLVFTILQFPWFYGYNPGANLTISLLIAAIPFAFLMILYWAMGVIMPRSGNDYVWVARTMGPAIGFAWSALYMFAVFATAFVGATSALTSGISTSFIVWGILYRLPSLVSVGNTLSAPAYGFTFSVGIALCFAALAIVGAKAVKRFLYTVWAIAGIGIAAIWGILLTTSTTTFSTKWNAALSSYLSYNGVTSLALQHGWTAAPVTFAASVIALPFTALFLLGGNFTNAVAGEVKNAKRAIPIALILSLVFGIVFWAVTAALTMHTVGSNWMYSLGYLWDSTPSVYSAAIPFAPTFPLMIALMAYPNQFLVSLILVTMVAGSIAVPFVYFWIPSRYFFAWSFDRVIPTSFAAVNKKYRTPHYSILTITVLSVIVFAAYWFTSWPTIETIGTFLWSFAFVIPGIAAMIFPYVKKDMFAGAPGWMGKRIAGIPVLSMLGAIVTVSFAYIGYLALVNPLIVTPTSYGVLVAAIVIVACFAIYYVGKWYHKKQGLDTELAFKEIPPV